MCLFDICNTFILFTFTSTHRIVSHKLTHPSHLFEPSISPVHRELGSVVARALLTTIISRKGLLEQSRKKEDGLNDVCVEFVSSCLMPFASAIIFFKLLGENNVISNESLRTDLMNSFEYSMVAVLDQCKSLHDAVNLFQFYPLEEDRVSLQRHIIQSAMKTVINHRYFQMYVDARWFGSSSMGVTHAIRTIGNNGHNGDVLGSFFILRLFSNYSIVGFIWKTTLATCTFGYHYIVFLPLTIFLGPVTAAKADVQKTITGEPSLTNALTVLSTPSVFSDIIHTTFIKFIYALCTHIVYIAILLYYTLALDDYNDEIRLHEKLEKTHAERIITLPCILLMVWNLGYLCMDIESGKIKRSKKIFIRSVVVWFLRWMYIFFFASILIGFANHRASSYCMAISSVFAMLRLIYFGQGHKTLGPLLIVIQEMCYRLLGFVVIFTVVLLSYWNFEAWTSFGAGKTVNTYNTDESNRIFVALFGEINPNSRPLSIYLIYGFLGVLLIAMMTDAHSSVKAKAHFEWQYLRAPSVMMFEMTPSAPVPFNTVHFLLKEVITILTLLFTTTKNKVVHREKADLEDDFEMKHEKGIKDEDEEVADTFSRQRDLEAIKLMKILLTQRKENRQRLQMLGIQKDLKDNQNIMQTNQTIMQSNQKKMQENQENMQLQQAKLLHTLKSLEAKLDRM